MKKNAMGCRKELLHRASHDAFSALRKKKKEQERGRADKVML